MNYLGAVATAKLRANRESKTFVVWYDAQEKEYEAVRKRSYEKMLSSYPGEVIAEIAPESDVYETDSWFVYHTTFMTGVPQKIILNADGSFSTTLSDKTFKSFDKAQKFMEDNGYHFVMNEWTAR